MAQTSGSGETNFKEVNAITTRFGKVIEPALQSRDNQKDLSEPNESNPSEKVVEAPIRVHFSQAFKSTSKSTTQHNVILKHLKQVKINLPLLHVFSQVSTYAKVLKDLCTMKRKHRVKKSIFLTEHVSIVIEQKILPKYKDPGCPTVSCIIKSHEISQALLDLGASVNIMSCDIYLSLGLREMKPTSVSLQLANRSTIRPREVVENVPFLATANALISCKNGLMKLSFGNMTLDVNIFHIMKQHKEDDKCHQTFLIDALVQEEAPDCGTSSTIITTELGAMQRTCFYIEDNATFSLGESFTWILLSKYLLSCNFIYVIGGLFMILCLKYMVTFDLTPITIWECARKSKS
ncbi:uncharacterized protein LOC111378083 [Olea europaea var. sylvestris]|uniref:uncharacterized protein LOC111378083 n=1 Tax=Olea europaea var. sylvestris TaxID=158386 RepID=UPI000C1CE872|nr:uncharacterized protein LOC111378083 [Olea europaea var. sylvestris]